MSAYNIPQCLVRMKIQLQEPILFVLLRSFINEDNENFTLLKSTRWLFQYSFIDDKNYSHMSHNGKKCEQ